MHSQQLATCPFGFRCAGGGGHHEVPCLLSTHFWGPLPGFLATSLVSPMACRHGCVFSGPTYPWGEALATAPSLLRALAGLSFPPGSPCLLRPLPALFRGWGCLLRAAGRQELTVAQTLSHRAKSSHAVFFKKRKRMRKIHDDPNYQIQGPREGAREVVVPRRTDASPSVRCLDASPPHGCE